MKDRILDRIESMHERLGTAGFALAVIALVIALAGGAYAAGGGLSSKQKKEVTKIAKKYAGKPGPAGPAGPQGGPGATGAPGKDGANGTNGTIGTNGTNGKSVVVGSFTGGDEEFGDPPGEPCDLQGGNEIEVEGSGEVEYACNGKQGSPWTAGGTLPEGATETGTFSSLSEAIVPISFPIPLENALPEAKVKLAPNPNCSGTAAEPKAASGFLCIYVQQGEVGAIWTLAQAGGAGSGADKSGALLFLNPETWGAFAVTG